MLVFDASEPLGLYHWVHQRYEVFQRVHTVKEVSVARVRRGIQRSARASWDESTSEDKSLERVFLIGWYLPSCIDWAEYEQVW